MSPHLAKTISICFCWWDCEEITNVSEHYNRQRVLHTTGHHDWLGYAHHRVTADTHRDVVENQRAELLEVVSGHRK